MTAGPGFAAGGWAPFADSFMTPRPGLQAPPPGSPMATGFNYPPGLQVPYPAVPWEVGDPGSAMANQPGLPAQYPANLMATDAGYGAGRHAASPSTAMAVGSELQGPPPRSPMNPGNRFAAGLHTPYPRSAMAVGGGYEMERQVAFLASGMATHPEMQAPPPRSSMTTGVGNAAWLHPPYPRRFLAADDGYGTGRQAASPGNIMATEPRLQAHLPGNPMATGVSHTAGLQAPYPCSAMTAGTGYGGRRWAAASGSPMTTGSAVQAPFLADSYAMQRQPSSLAAGDNYDTEMQVQHPRDAMCTDEGLQAPPPGTTIPASADTGLQDVSCGSASTANTGYAVAVAPNDKPDSRRSGHSHVSSRWDEL